jgi:hypothetical protein
VTLRLSGVACDVSAPSTSSSITVVFARLTGCNEEMISLNFFLAVDYIIKLLDLWMWQLKALLIYVPGVVAL